MKTSIAATLFAVLLVVPSVRAAESKRIVAHATGYNYGAVDTNVVVTATEQKVFHFHSDMAGGGTWYDVFIGIEGKYVKVRECDAAGSTDKDGKEKMTSTERIFLIPLEMITKHEINLKMQNRIILTKDE